MPPTESEITTSVVEHQARNGELRILLIKKGVDLCAPRKIDCYFVIDGSENAQRLAASLVDLGFQILDQDPSPSPKNPHSWNLEASIQQSAELTIRREFTEELV